jgi:hypothetical protein
MAGSYNRERKALRGAIIWVESEVGYVENASLSGNSVQNAAAIYFIYRSAMDDRWIMRSQRQSPSNSPIFSG